MSEIVDPMGLLIPLGGLGGAVLILGLGFLVGLYWRNRK